MYLGITSPMAAWFRGKTGAVEGLYEMIRQTMQGDGSGVLAGEEGAYGAIRISRGDAGGMIRVWNSDYLTGTGEELWGFVNLSSDVGIFAEAWLGYVVLERCLLVVEQRLQGLKIDGAMFPRTWEGNIHTCAAGRGSGARKYSLGYFEKHIGGQVGAAPALICFGPMDDFQRIMKVGAVEAAKLSALVAAANKAISPTRKVRPARNVVVEQLGRVFAPFVDAELAQKGYEHVQIGADVGVLSHTERLNSASLTYAQWIAPASPLSSIQRRILTSDAILKHPLRVVGPAGSGKSLLMQLLAIRRLKAAVASGSALRLLYVAHNDQMVRSVRQRFEILLSDDLMGVSQEVLLDVRTLSEISRDRLEVEDNQVIDTDAEEAKNYQLGIVVSALKSAIQDNSKLLAESPVLKVIAGNDPLLVVFAKMIVSEISQAIKGQGLQKNKRRYVESEKALSRLHGVLNHKAREFVFEVFESYNREVFEAYGLLDSDDLAISLLGKLRTPIWELRRKTMGYDFVFVDETQLFNENERRIFPLLCKSLEYVPIVLALDEAQSIFGQSSAGFAALGIENISNESLPSIHRSTRAIVDLAFFIVQRCGDLFGPDFPDFTKVTERLADSNHPLAAPPVLERCPSDQPNFGKFVRKRVGDLRKSNQRQIAVVVHGDRYWDEIRTELAAADLPLVELLTRGESISGSAPVVVLTRPDFVGGQEFDSVILVGLEQGVVPPAVSASEAFNVTLEQQAFREIYLSVTRARYRVVVALSTAATPTGIIGDAIAADLISYC